MVEQSEKIPMEKIDELKVGIIKFAKEKGFDLSVLIISGNKGKAPFTTEIITANNPANLIGYFETLKFGILYRLQQFKDDNPNPDRPSLFEFKEGKK